MVGATDIWMSSHGLNLNGLGALSARTNFEIMLSEKISGRILPDSLITPSVRR